MSDVWVDLPPIVGGGLDAPPGYGDLYLSFIYSRSVVFIGNLGLRSGFTIVRSVDDAVSINFFFYTFCRLVMPLCQPEMTAAAILEVNCSYHQKTLLHNQLCSFKFPIVLCELRFVLHFHSFIVPLFVDLVHCILLFALRLSRPSCNQVVSDCF